MEALQRFHLILIRSKCLSFLSAIDSTGVLPLL